MARKSLSHPPSLLDYNGMKFLIFDAPTDRNMQLYIKEFKKHNVVRIVRTCEQTYSTEQLTQMNIKCTALNFADGTGPSTQQITSWLRIVKKTFKQSPNSTLGVHCVAGLGRAPLLVCVALIEDGVSPQKAIEMVRNVRSGALNSNQIRWLRKYHKKSLCIIS